MVVEFNKGITPHRSTGGDDRQYLNIRNDMSAWGHKEMNKMNSFVHGHHLEMLHKLSDPWKNAYDMDCSAMADDNVDTTTDTTMHYSNGVANNTGIVNTMLRKANGYSEGVCSSPGLGSGSLEQKIQELAEKKMAEKEAGEIKRCEQKSPANDQDSPLDFSVKRRSSFSGSLTDDSQASSSSPGHVTDYSTVSPPVELGSTNHNGDSVRRATPSPETQDELNRKHMGFPNPSAMPPLINAMGLFNGLPTNLMRNGTAINAFSQMAAAAAFMDPKNNKKSNRPFKAYPKEALQMPLGFLGIPGMSAAAFQQGMEPGALAGMSSEEISNLYNQQLQMLREKLPSSKLSEKSSPPSQVPHLPTSNGNDTSPHHTQQSPYNHHNSSYNGHHNHTKQSQMQSNEVPQYPRHSSPSSPNSHHQSQSDVSLSPPQSTADLMSSFINSPSAFPTPQAHVSSAHSSSNSSSSPINTTLVSSTSSFSFNSRKRPTSLPEEQKDSAYWERRRKNNDAAKRSRDARRAKEDEIAIRAALLEQENIKLRVEVAALKTETARLRVLLYNS